MPLEITGKDIPTSAHLSEISLLVLTNIKWWNDCLMTKIKYAFDDICFGLVSEILNNQCICNSPINEEVTNFFLAS